MTALFDTPLWQSVVAASPAADSDFWYQPVGTMTPAGVSVTPESAMRTSAVFSCVRVIAETAGSMPLILYRRLERGKERASTHPIYNLLRYAPNPQQTALEFLEMMTAHCALRGNAFALPVLRRGVLAELWPLHPDRVQVGVNNGRVGYVYTDPDTQTAYRYTAGEIFHLRGLSSNGIVGMSPVEMARNSIGLALASEDYGSRFFQNDATPRLLLKHPGHFRDKEGRENFKRAWQTAQSGANRFRTAVLEDGMDVKELGVSNADAQFLETRKYQVADIARIFRVPLVLIGETEKSTSWGTGIEQFMQAFVTHTMRPWFVRWEQAIYRDFLADDAGASEYFAEFLVDALLRGDTATRFAAYKSGIETGWLTRNEARERENMNPLDGLDDPLQPMNMGVAGPADSEGSPPDDSEDDPGAERMAAANRREVAAMRRLCERYEGVELAAAIRRFYGSHAAYMRGVGIPAEDAEAHCRDRLEAALAAENGDDVLTLATDWENAP